MIEDQVIEEEAYHQEISNRKLEKNLQSKMN